MTRDRFVPRHRDEITVDIGDPVYVHIEAEDGWCEGEQSHYLLSAERVKVMAGWNFDGPGPIDNFLPASTPKSALKLSPSIYCIIIKEARALEL